VRKDYFLNLYPSSLYTFTDSLPDLAQDTKPHGSAQTLEAISNLSNVSGQSIVAFMRESRNKTRLLETGIPLDNNIPDSLSDAQVKQLTTNGLLPDPSIDSYTLPAWATNKDPITNETINPIPNGIFSNGQFNQTNEVAAGDIIPIIENQPNPVVSTLIPVGPEIETPLTEPYIIAVPIQVNPAIPPQLDTQYTSSTLLPSSPTIQEAIDKVIECNCDCWVN
jgi:hypothetical protein